MIWFHAMIGGQRWTVELVPRTHPLLAPDLDGLTIRDSCRVLIADHLSESLTQSTLVHELLDHAVNFASGAHMHFAGESEEAAVSRREPLLHRLLLDMGFRFPRMPRRPKGSKS